MSDGPVGPRRPLDAGDWLVSGSKVRRVYAALTILFGSMMVFMLVGYMLHPHRPNDFFAFNSFSRFMRTYPPALLYDQDLVRAFQDLPQRQLFAFMYHPGMMLLLWPLASLPYDLGYVIWVGIGLCACTIAVAGRREGWPLALLVLAAPSTLWTELCGQSSLLVTALLIGGLRLSPYRPLLAGVLIGLATYKPQLGVLVPVALLVAGRWRTVLSAATTTLLIVAATTILFGIDVWPSWFHHLSSILKVRSDHASDWAMLLATLSANLTVLGAGRRLADGVQILGFVVAAATMVWCFRRNMELRHEESLLQVAALGVATFIATPFAFIYDLPLLTAATLLFAQERRRSGGAFRFREVLAMVLALLLPYLMVTSGMVFCSSLVVLVMLGTILQRIREVRSPGPARGYGVTI